MKKQVTEFNKLTKRQLRKIKKEHRVFKKYPTFEPSKSFRDEYLDCMDDDREIFELRYGDFHEDCGDR